MLKVGYHTLGCKVNQYETEAITELFEQKGYETVAFDEIADIYIINTCTVTNIADKKSRKMLSKAKTLNHNAVVVAMGCYAQVAKDLLQENPEIDLIIGNTKKNEIVDLVENYLNQHSKINAVEDMTHQDHYEELWVSRNEDKKRAHIKVQDGCNQFCSYCIIPYTRGRVRSRSMESVIQEVETIVHNGYKEVILTGIHLASYGAEFEGYGLIDLIEAIDQVEGLKRLRLGSLEPTLISVEFVDRLKKLTTICPHFHLSLQSGCDETLLRMNRKYTTQDYRASVKLLRQAFDRPSITTDIIVGFPDEIEAEFQITKAFIEEISFSDLHVFKYSPRSGTKAAIMKNQVDEKVKNERSKILTDVRNRLYGAYLNQFIGDQVEVLFEEGQELDGKAFFAGHTSNYLRIITPDQGIDLERKMLFVELKGIYKEFLEGDLVT